MKNSYNRSYTLTAVCLLAFAALAVFAYFIITGGGVFTVRDDFNAQQIPFTAALHDAVKEGGLTGFNWSVDLGSSNLLSFGFYELGSIFFWLSLLIPTDKLPYFIALLYILKYVTAGLLAYFYISLFVKNRDMALLGGILYAFSGFQAVNLMFYHFHEAVAFFPLLLLGLEKMMKDDGREGSFSFKDQRSFCLFSFAVFLNCITNYFFFIQDVIFLVIYFLCRFADKDLKATFRRIIKCVLGGLLGTGMAAVIFLPSVIYILGGERASEFIGLSQLWHSTESFLQVLGGCLLPADPMHDGSILVKENWKSMNCYLPLMGAGPLIVTLSKKRDWLFRVLTVCVIFSLSPLLSSAFTMLTEYYVRWWYMFVLMMALAASVLTEEGDKASLIKGFGINAVLVAVFYLTLCYVKWLPTHPEISIVINENRFRIYCGTAFAGALLAMFLAKLGNARAWVASALVFGVISTFFTLYFYKAGSADPGDYIKDYGIARQLSRSDDILSDQYRLDLNNNNIYTMAGHQAGLAGFISTRSSGISEFEDLFDYYSTNNGIDKGDYRGLTELLGGRYEVSDEPRDDEPVFFAENGGKALFIYDDQDACPIGFCLDRYIWKSDLKNIDPADRAMALLQAAVVEDGTAPEGMQRVYPGELNLQAKTDYFTELYRQNCVKDFSRDPKGFRCTSDFDTDRSLYFAVPFDSGWDCYIDGKKTGITDSGGMMLLRVPAGKHEIDFKYFTPYLKHGIFISLISWLIFAALMILRMKRQKDHGKH